MTANWIEAKLGDVCTSSKGKKPKILQDSEFENSVPYLDIQAFEKGNIRQFADKTSSRLCSEGDVLIVWDGARSGLVGKGILGALGSTIASIQSSVTKNQYLLSFLELQYDYINSNAKGTGIPHVNPDLLWDITIPIPPLNEQKRIVEKLEKIIPKAQSCKKRLEKISLILKRFRKSVLSSACSGELTRDWRLNHDSPDLKINHDLKEEKSRKSSNHENQGSDIPPSWREVKLETLLKVDPQNGLYKPQEFYGRGSLIVRIDNFYDGVLAPWEKLRRLELDAQEQERYRLEENDILVNRVNSIDFLGKSALVRNVQELCVFESNMMRLQFALDSTNPEYIIIYLNSIKGTTELRKNAKHAVNQASINQKDVKDVLINLPLLEEQTEIVKRVEELFAIADKIEERYKKAKKQVDKVQLSLLAKAFRGELVPQNPNDKPIALPLSPLSRGNSKKE